MQGRCSTKSKFHTAKQRYTGGRYAKEQLCKTVDNLRAGRVAWEEFTTLGKEIFKK
jgi:hypothetical protein